MTRKQQAYHEAGIPLLTAEFNPATYDFADPEHNQIDQAILIVAKRRFGKSVFAANLMYHERNRYPYVFAWTLTKHNGFWQQFIPENLIFDHFSEETLEKILAMQKKRFKMRGINPYVRIMWDDFAAVQDLKFSVGVRTAMFNGRHYALSSIYMTQHFTAAATSSRTNADKIILFYTEHEPTLDHLQNEFGNSFTDMWTFRAWFNRMTEGHRFVVVDQAKPGTRGEEKFKVGEASLDVLKKDWGTCIPAAWGGRSKSEAIKAQRKKWPLPPDYEESTLRKYAYNSELTARDEPDPVLDEVDPQLDDDAALKSLFLNL